MRLDSINPFSSTWKYNSLSERNPHYEFFLLYSILLHVGFKLTWVKTWYDKRSACTFLGYMLFFLLLSMKVIDWAFGVKPLTRLSFTRNPLYPFAAEINYNPQRHGTYRHGRWDSCHHGSGRSLCSLLAAASLRSLHPLGPLFLTVTLHVSPLHFGNKVWVLLGILDTLQERKTDLKATIILKGLQFWFHAIVCLTWKKKAISMNLPWVCRRKGSPA